MASYLYGLFGGGSDAAQTFAREREDSVPIAEGNAVNPPSSTQQPGIASRLWTYIRGEAPSHASNAERVAERASQFRPYYDETYESDEDATSSDANAYAERQLWELEETERGESENARRLNTEEDDRGTLPRIANIVAQIPGAGMVVRSEYLRNKIKEKLFGNADVSAHISSMKGLLKKIPGGEELGNVLKVPSKMLANELLEGLLTSYPGFKQFTDLEDGLLENVVETLLLKAALNVAVNAGDNSEEDLSTVILSQLLKFITEGLDEVSKKRFEEIGKLRNVNERKRQYRELFKPAANKFLDVALPKSSLQELGYPLFIRDLLGNEAIPDLLVKIYPLTHNPDHHTEKDLIYLERKGGAAIKAIAKFFANKAKALLPKVLEQKSATLPSDIINKVGEAAPLEAWLQKMLAEVATSEDPEIQNVWDFVQRNIESLLIHALTNLSGSEGNLLDNLLSNVLVIFKQFFTEEKISEIDKAFEQYANLPEAERDQKLDALFVTLADRLLQKADLESNWIGELVKDVLPTILREFYAVKGQEIKTLLTVSLQFQNDMFDEGVPVTVEVGHRGEDSDEKLLEASGVKHIIDDVETGCGLLAKLAMNFLKGFLPEEENSVSIAKLLNEGLFDNTLSEIEESDCAEGLQSFFSRDLASLANTFEPTVKILLFTFLALWSKEEASKIAGEEGRTKNKNSKVPEQMLESFLSIVNELFAIEKGPLDEEAIRELYQPIARKFLELAGYNAETDTLNFEKMLPVAEYAQGPLRELLESTILPPLLYKLHLEMNASNALAPEKAEKLDYLLNEARLFLTSMGFNTDIPDGFEAKNNGSVFIGRLAKFIEAKLPHYVETNPEIITLLSIIKLSSYFPEFESEMTHEEQKRALEVAVQTIRNLGKSDELKLASKQSAEYLSAFALQILSGFVEVIDKKEKNQKNLRLEIAIAFFTLMGGHVDLVHGTPPEGRTSPAYTVPPKLMHQGFAERGGLHPALALDHIELHFDPGTSQKEKDEQLKKLQEMKDQQRLNKFYKPFVKDLLSLAGVTSSDLPIPAAHEKAWESLQDDVLPNMMMSIFKEILRPETLNKMMLKTFEALQAIEEADSPEAILQNEGEKDEHQQRLDKAIGGLIMGMIELVPDWFTLTIFKKEKFINMGAEALGQIVRQQLDSTTLVGLIDQALENFEFPDPKADDGKTEAQKAAENRAVQETLSKKMTAYISQQAKAKVKAFRSEKWKNFQNSIDKFIEEKLGSKGLAVKHVLDVICNFIFIKVIGTLVDFLVFTVLWYFVDLVINQKSKEIIKDVHMPIHENLLYKLCEEFISQLKEVKHQEDELVEMLRIKEEEEAAAKAAEAAKAALLNPAQPESKPSAIDEDEIIIVADDPKMEERRKNEELIQAARIPQDILV